MKKIAVVAALLAIALVTGWQFVSPREEDPLIYCPSVETRWLLQPVTTADRASSIQQQVVPVENLTTQCDQRAWLKAVASRVTSAGNTETEKMVLWAGFLQAALYHSCNAPLDGQGQAVYSPIWILEHRGVQCGQAARVFVDGMTAMGMRARLVQLRNHVAAEGWADGKWHFIETDALNDGEQIHAPDGTIASVAEILASPALLDQVTPSKELAQYPVCTNLSAPPPTYQSIFERHRYQGDEMDTPYVIRKTSTPEQERNHYFGWNYYVKCGMDEADCNN